MILALIALAPIWAGCLYLLYLGFFHGDGSLANHIYRWLLIASLALTYSAFHCVRKECYPGFVGAVALLMVTVALLTSIFLVGLLLLPSAILMVIVATSMKD